MIKLKMNIHCPKHTSAIFFKEPKFYYNNIPIGRIILIFNTTSEAYDIDIPLHQALYLKDNTDVRTAIRLQILQNEISKHLR